MHVFHQGCLRSWINICNTHTCTGSCTCTTQYSVTMPTVYYTQQHVETEESKQSCDRYPPYSWRIPLHLYYWLGNMNIKPRQAEIQHHSFSPDWILGPKPTWQIWSVTNVWPFCLKPALWWKVATIWHGKHHGHHLTDHKWPPLPCKALKLGIHTADTMHTLEGICKWKQVHHISPNINNYTDSLSPHRFVSLGNLGSNTCWWRAVIGGNIKPLGSYIRWCTDVPPPTDECLGQCMCHRASSQKKGFHCPARCWGGNTVLWPPCWSCDPHTPWACWRNWWVLSCWTFIQFPLLLSGRSLVPSDSKMSSRGKLPIWRTYLNFWIFAMTSKIF